MPCPFGLQKCFEEHMMRHEEEEEEEALICPIYITAQCNFFHISQLVRKLGSEYMISTSVHTVPLSRSLRAMIRCTWST